MNSIASMDGFVNKKNWRVVVAHSSAPKNHLEP
jgi:hypothetical protein